MFGKNNQFTVTDDAEDQHVKNKTVCLYLEEERQSDNLDYQFLLPISFRFRKKNPNSYLRFKAKCIGKDDDYYSQLIEIFNSSIANLNKSNFTSTAHSFTLILFRK